jgi:putative flavoprotein involved in K+ transport
MAARTERLDTVVVGGGQAGLAAGYHLARQGRSYVVLDASERIGDSWRNRWPSLRLYSPARSAGLPGMPFPAPRSSFPSGSEMADYLEAYAEKLELAVRTGVRVDGIEKDGDTYVVSAGERRFEAPNVVVATGVFQKPRIPDLAHDLDPRIRQLHSARYRDPSQVEEGPVLVVGAAHSGADIAYELARAGWETTLVGRDTGAIPVPLESRRARLVWPVLVFLWTRVFTMSTPIGRRMRSKVREHGGPLLRVKNAELEAAGVERVFERVVGVTDGQPTLADGRVLPVRTVIWATGFESDYSWIRVPFESADGYPVQQRGAVPSSPGLYFVGLPFLHSFSSMLILGAGPDAEHVVRHIVRRSASGEHASDVSAAPAESRAAA